MHDKDTVIRNMRFHKKVQKKTKIFTVNKAYKPTLMQKIKLFLSRSIKWLK